VLTYALRVQLLNIQISQGKPRWAADSRRACRLYPSLFRSSSLNAIAPHICWSYCNTNSSEWLSDPEASSSCLFARCRSGAI